MKALIWNTISLKSQMAFQRVQMLHKFPNFSFIALLESFQHVGTIQSYRNRLHMPLVFCNFNGKVWLLTNHGFDTTTVSNSKLQLTILLENRTLGLSFLTTIVYAKCERNQRLEIWEDIYSIASDIIRPWMVGGDLSVVLNSAEKIGECTVMASEIKDFQTCIESCDLL